MACTEHDQRKFSIEKRGLARMSFRRVVISLLQLHCKDSMVRLFLLERTTNSLLGSSRIQRSGLATALPRHVREASTQRLTRPKTKPFGSLEKPNHLNDLACIQAMQMIGISRATKRHPAKEPAGQVTHDVPPKNVWKWRPCTQEPGASGSRRMRPFACRTDRPSIKTSTSPADHDVSSHELGRFCVGRAICLANGVHLDALCHGSPFSGFEAPCTPSDRESEIRVLDGAWWYREHGRCILLVLWEVRI